MKMAKASEADIDAAGKAMGLLDNLSRGYYPGVEDDAPLHFDPEDHAHLSLLYRLLTETLDASPGWPGRVIGGMCYVILYPANRIIDPDSDCIDLHPRFAESEALLRRAVVALDESRDDVLNTINSYVPHPYNEKRVKPLREQLARHDEVIAAIRQHLGEQA